MVLSPTGLPNTTDHVSEHILRLPPVAEQPTEVLISTQQVLLGTAAAVGARPRGREGHLAAAIHHLFANSPDESHPRPRYYPREYGFIENARMAREMGRL
ncbi:MAG: hypothetical protein JOZ00_15505 [Mycobacterium sp.]|uniref:hypothetical protein n=1 Tax=Mycobacterium sp. TaxID=1785 RepID=UPI001EBA1855|nr:hypothetical protein [Mycobacterium sp.]MBV8788082.1 hypothetical protein [Mycobacterium sp.]